MRRLALVSVCRAGPLFMPFLSSPQAQVGSVGAVQLLIDAGANPSVTNKFDESPLHFAVRNNRLPVVKVLVGAGANRDQKTFGGDTALVLAQKYRMKAVEDYLTCL